MKKRNFPFLKICSWLYQSAMSAGILFLAEAFFRKELGSIVWFSDSEKLLAAAFAAALMLQLLLYWPGESQKRRLYTLGGILLANAAAAYLVWKYTGPMGETMEGALDGFLCYAALEATALGCCTLIAAIKERMFGKGVVVLGFAVGLAVLGIWGRQLPGWCVCIMFVAALLFLAQAGAKKRKETVGLLPVFAAASAVLLLLPAGEKPADWSWVKAIGTAVQEQADALLVDAAYFFGGESGFSFSYAGYGTGGGLGGAVWDNDRPQLLIQGMRTKKPLYLSGETYEYYTGTSWEHNDTGANSGTSDISQAIRQSVYRDASAELLSSARIAVEYKIIRTTSFFRDLYTQTVYYEGQKPEFDPERPCALRSAQGKGFRYQFQFLEANDQDERLKQILRQKAWREDAVWDAAQQAEEAQAREWYLQLPETLPERVRTLAAEITKGLDNDYDRMCAIAAYLQRFSYTKNPPAGPEGQDFTDFFLFDGKTGYCTYFATALAVLGRCEGIPTRYVKGFTSADTCRDFQDGLALKGDQAHAWTEFYVAHVGWVRLDATPGYAERAVPGVWQRQETAPQGMGAAESLPPAEEEKTAEENAPTGQNRAKGWYWETLLTAGALFITLLGLFFCIAVLRRGYRKKRYEKADTAGKLLLMMKQLFRLGKLEGAPVLENETLEAYALRLAGRLDTGDETFEEICRIYEKARFGGENIKKEELMNISAYTKRAEEQYLESCGFFAKLAYRLS
ncbi:MAG: transglutaminase-like domain-containing protein [Oscillospiraceae bacterium]|nr:transglutaminase-like domain-containing protein [Oscillospiraceae bacterium]